jgi:hypothetical protein
LRFGACEAISRGSDAKARETHILQFTIIHLAGRAGDAAVADCRGDPLSESGRAGRDCGQPRLSRMSGKTSA